MGTSSGVFLKNSGDTGSVTVTATSPIESDGTALYAMSKQGAVNATVTDVTGGSASGVVLKNTGTSGSRSIRATGTVQVCPDSGQISQQLFYAEGKYSKFIIDETVEFLDRYYPIVITLSIDRTFRSPRTEDDLAIFEQKSVLKNHLLHAVFVVGY